MTGVPNLFANVSTAIPLAQLDQNFATPITIGNATVVLGGTVSNVGNLSLVNATIISLASALAAGNGGTGLSASGTSGNVLTADGSGGWASAAPTIPGGFSWQSVQTSAFAAVTKNGYPVNTTGGAITATLAASPSAGDYVTFVDYAGTFTANPLTINPNGKKINGSTSNASLSSNGASVTLVYADETRGWIPYSGLVISPLHPAPAFSAYQSASQPVTGSVVSGVQLQTKEFDTNSNFASSRFTPSVAGYYQLNGAVSVATTPCLLWVSIAKNGAVYKTGNQVDGSVSGAVSSLVYLNGSTDFVELWVYLSVGQYLSATLGGTYFNGAMVRGS